MPLLPSGQLVLVRLTYILVSSNDAKRPHMDESGGIHATLFVQDTVDKTDHIITNWNRDRLRHTTYYDYNLLVFCVILHAKKG